MSVIEKPKVTQIEWFDSHFYRVDFDLSDDGDKPETRYIPSVTTKLGSVAKPFLAHWRGDIGNREADLRVMEAADRGSRVHYAYDVFKRGGAVIYQPFNRPTYTQEEINKIFEDYAGIVSVLNHQEEMYQVYKLQRLYKILKPTVLFSEHIVYSLESNDAGQVDDIWQIEAGEYKVIGAKPLIIEESGLYVNDLKTGKEIDDDAFLQTAVYLKLAESMGLGEFKGTLITHTQAKTKQGIEGLTVYHRKRPQVEQDYSDYLKIADIWQRKFGDLRPKCFEFPSLITQKKEK